MDDKVFKQRVARLERVAAVVEKLPTEIRAQAFSLLEPYVTGDVVPERLAPKRPHEAAEDTPENDDTREAFFGAHNHEDPSDNVRLLTAYLYREHGSAPYTVQELKTLADDVGVTVPERIDMTLRSAKEDGKKLYASSGRGLFKPTVHGEAHFKSQYNVKKGRKPKPVAKPEGAK